MPSLLKNRNHQTNVPVVIGEYTSETRPVFLTKAKECNAEIHFASDLISENYPSDLIGPTNFIIKNSLTNHLCLE
jgi:hypothetical protein